MAVNNATGYNRTTNEPLDAIYLNSGSTYSSTASVNAEVNIGVRYTGSMFNVNGELYWYKDGVQDNDLVLFNGPISSSLYNLSSSVYTSSASFDGRLDYIEDRYATTGSNLFRGEQYVSGGIHAAGPVTFTEGLQTNIAPGRAYFYVSQSGAGVSDFYWSKYSGSLESTTRLGWIEGNLYTGLLHGGTISAVTGSTTYTVAEGHGIVVDLNASLAVDSAVNVHRVAWPTSVVDIAPLSASYDQTYIAIDHTGSVYVQGDPYNDGQYNTLIPLGVVLHQNRSTVNGSVTFPSLAYGWKQRSSDFLRAFGPLKLSGFGIYTSSSLGLTVGSGTAFADGRNYTADPNNPSYVVDPGISVSKIYRYRQSGSSWVYDTNSAVGYTTIDPSNYSNTGSLTPVPGSGANKQWSIQRVFMFPNSATKAIYVYYGNTTYLTAADAVASLNYEPFIEAHNTASQAIYLGALIVRNDAVFTDSTTYRILPAGLFRSVGGSGGGGSVITQLLSGLSDVNISGPTDGQPLAYSAISNKWENVSAISSSLHGNADSATSSSYAYSSSYAATSSYADNLLVGGNVTVVGTITAQKLVVQTITSSVIYSSGSNVFGNSLANTQVLSGSVYITGDGYMNGSQLMTSASVVSNYFKNGGNSFGASTSLGTNDNRSLLFRTNGSNRVILDTVGTFGSVTDSWKFTSAGYLSLHNISIDTLSPYSFVAPPTFLVQSSDISTDGTDVMFISSSDVITALNIYTKPEINNFFSGTTAITGYNKSNWDTAYTNRITSLTTTGTSGAATLVSNVLNIPQYQSVLTNPVTGTGVSGLVAYWNGTNSLTSSSSFTYNGNTLAVTATGIGIHAGVFTTDNNTGVPVRAINTSIAGNLFVGSNGISDVFTVDLYGTIYGSGFDISTSSTSYAGVLNNSNISGTGLAINAASGVNPALLVKNYLNSTELFKVLGNGAVSAAGSFTAGSIIKTSGTSVQFLKADGSVDSNTYLTGNQTITLSGDVSGSGTTAITTAIGALKVTNGMLAGSIDYAKMNAATVPTWNQNTTGTAASLSAVLSKTLGGAGDVSGILKANGSGVVSAAVAGTDYVAPSALSGYLPLTAGSGQPLSGTLTMSMGNNTQIFQSATATTGWQYWNMNNTSGQLQYGVESSTGSSLIAGSAAYSSYIGTNSGFTAPFYLVTNGTIRASVSSTAFGLTVPISGTSLSMSDSATAASLNTSNSATLLGNWNSSNANGGYFAFQRSGVNKGFIGISANLLVGGADNIELRSDANLYLTGGASGDVAIYSRNALAATFGASQSLILSGSLSGTSLSMSGGADITGITLVNRIDVRTGNPLLFWNPGATEYGRFSLDASNNLIYNVGGGSTLLSVSSTGAATFSSSVNATNLFVYTTGQTLQVKPSSANENYKSGFYTSSTDNEFYMYNGSASQTVKILASTGAATFSSSVTASSFIGAGSGLTSLPSNTALYPTLNQNTTGNAATATTATNWSGYSQGAISGGSIGYLMSYNGTGWGYSDQTAIRTFLGLGSYAYRSAGLAELTGADFSGYITALGGGNSSDLTLKNILHYSSKLNIADNVSIIKYTWKDLSKGTIPRFGYGAQDLLPLIPEAVYKTSNGTYAVDYTQVHTVLIDENTRRIKSLEQEVLKLKNQVKSLGGNI